MLTLEIGSSTVFSFSFYWSWSFVRGWRYIFSINNTTQRRSGKKRSSLIRLPQKKESKFYDTYRIPFRGYRIVTSRLSQDDFIVIVSSILFFVAFFVAIFTQYRAEASIFRICFRWVGKNWTRVRFLSVTFLRSKTPFQTLGYQPQLDDSKLSFRGGWRNVEGKGTKTESCHHSTADIITGKWNKRQEIGEQTVQP